MPPEKNKPAEWTKEETDKIALEVKKRAMKDPEFRALALSNPQAAVAKFNSTPFPTGYKVRCIEQAGYNVTVVLPDPVARVEELSDAELEQVAGGVNRNNVNL
ncbi:MAG: hypothetical protein ABSH02_00375 [Candidatus Sulfotelmatobacter sp.]|jgi:hypothetical protein